MKLCKIASSVAISFALTLGFAQVSYADDGALCAVGLDAASWQTADAEGLQPLGDEGLRPEEGMPLAPDGYVVSSDNAATSAKAAAETDAKLNSPSATDARRNVSRLSTQAQSTSGTCGAHLTWSLADGTLRIDGAGAMDDFSSSNQPGWSDQKSQVKSVVVSEGVTSIGSQAFVACTNLASIDFPSSVSSVGEAAFYRCYALHDVVLPQSVTVLRGGVFVDCANLGSLQAPGLTTIEDYALQGVGLSELVIPDSVTTIGSLAFFKNAIESFSVSSGNTTYSSNNGVLYCDGGETLLAYPTGSDASTCVVPEGVKKIADSAFSGARITTVSLPKTLTELGMSAFQQSDLKSVSLPDSLTTADYFTFYDCGSLESVVFGKGLKSTSYLMFGECYSLAQIDFGGLEELYAQTFANCTSLVSVTIPSTVKSLGSGVFGCDPDMYPSLESIVIEGAAVVPFQGFLNQTALESVTLGSGVNTVARGAFAGCTALAQVEIPSNVVFVHHWAFPDATQLVCRNDDLSVYAGHGLQKQESIYIEGTTDYAEAFAVLSLVNKERAAAGLSELRMDESLMETAMMRAAETAVLFSHTRPDSSICFTANDKMTAENIAFGQVDANAVMKTWMNSEGHRANILGDDFASIGIGCVRIDNCLYWVQCFGADELSQDCSMPNDRSFEQLVNVAARTFEEGATSPTGTVFSSGDSEEYTPAFSVSLDDEMLELGASTTAHLKVVNQPGGVSVPVVKALDSAWSVSDECISVDDAGKVSALGVGTAAVKWQGRFLSAEKTIEAGRTAVRDLKDATVIGLSAKRYTGKAITPNIRVEMNGEELVKGADYSVLFKNNVNVGTASVTIEGMGDYAGQIRTTFPISKADNSIQVKKTLINKSYKAKVLKKANKVISLPVVKAKFGKASWRVVAKDKTQSLKLANGKVRVKKGAKKGKHVIKLRAVTSKTKNYSAAKSKVVTVKVSVK